MTSNKAEEKFTIPEGILSDLCSRFIINAPQEERSDMIRLFFQIELAHWFYLDFYCDTSFSNQSSSSSSGGSSGSSSSSSSSGSSSSSSDDGDSSDDEDDEHENLIRLQPHQDNLSKPCSIRVFAENIFRHCPSLMQHSNQVDDILSKWKVFKHALPTNGAIMIDESMRYVLLVQGFWAKASWGFPKGKVIEDETESKCAIREVLEETGYDISDKIDENEYLQININDQTIRLYIVTNVSMQTKFEPRTRREIKDVRWFAIDELPVHRKDARFKDTLGYSPNSFFMVIPFVKALRRWVSIKNKVDSGHTSLNYGSSISNSASKLLKTTLNNNRSQSTINHKRTNSISCYTNSNSNHRNGNHHNHHLHHHSHHLKDNNHSLNHYSSSYNQHSIGNKALSKSNENLMYQSPSNNASSNKTPKSKLKHNNPFLKHYANSTNQMKFNYENGDYDDNNGNMMYVDDNNNKQKLVNNNYKQQAHAYQKMQQNEFADLLGFKEAALANKTNRLTSSVSSQQISTSQTSKFKPIQSSKNKSYCNFLSNNQNINNQPNGNYTNEITPKNKTNENIIQNQTSSGKNSKALSNSNGKSKTPNNLTVNNNSIKQQTQAYQKMQQNEFADLLAYKEAALANKTNKMSPSGQQAASKFKPINPAKKSNNNQNIKTNNQNQFIDNNNNSYNNNNNGKKQITLNTLLNSNTSLPISLHISSTSSTSTSLDASKYTTQNMQQINNKLRKQLEFNGPECWVNFKFDYDTIMQNLPPLLKL